MGQTPQQHPSIARKERKVNDGARAPNRDEPSPLELDKAERAFVRADDGVRTRDPQLGKLMLYQLSYVRAAPRLAAERGAGGARWRLPRVG